MKFNHSDYRTHIRSERLKQHWEKVCYSLRKQRETTVPKEADREKVPEGRVLNQPPLIIGPLTIMAKAHRTCSVLSTGL